MLAGIGNDTDVTDLWKNCGKANLENNVVVKIMQLARFYEK